MEYRNVLAWDMFLGGAVLNALARDPGKPMYTTTITLTGRVASSQIVTRMPQPECYRSIGHAG